MSDITVSNDVDNLLKSTNKEAIRESVGLGSGDTVTFGGLNLPSGVTYGMLSTQLQNSLVGNLDPEDYIGEIDSASFVFPTPDSTNNGKWYFINGVNGYLSGANAPTTAPAEDGGFVFSDGSSWNLRGATPSSLMNGQVGVAKLSPDLMSRLGMTQPTPATPNTEITPAANLVILGPSSQAANNLTPNGFTGTGTHDTVALVTDHNLGMSVTNGEELIVEYEISDPSVFSRITTRDEFGAEISNRITTASSGLNTGTLTITADSSDVQLFVRVEGAQASDLTGVVVSNVRIYRNDGTEQGEDGVKVSTRLDTLEATVTVNDNNITGLDTRLDTVEGNINTIQNSASEDKPIIEIKGSESFGDVALMTMPQLDFGVKDFTISGAIQRQLSRQLVCSNVSSNVGLQLWWESDGKLTLIIGNGSDLATYSYTSSVSADVSVGEWAHLTLSVGRSDVAKFFVNGKLLGAALDVSNSSAQTVSSGVVWTFGGDGVLTTPCALADHWLFEEGAINQDIATERKLAPNLQKRTFLPSVDIFPPSTYLLEFGGASLSRMNAEYVDFLGQSDWLRLSPTLETNTHLLQWGVLPVNAEIGDNVRFELDAYIPTGNVDATGLRIDLDYNGASVGSTLYESSLASSKGKVVTLRGESTMTAFRDGVRLWVRKGTTSTYLPASTEYVYVRNFRVYINGAKRLIDMRPVGATKQDKIGSNDANRNAAAIDIN